MLPNVSMSKESFDFRTKQDFLPLEQALKPVIAAIHVDKVDDLVLGKVLRRTSAQLAAFFKTLYNITINVETRLPTCDACVRTAVFNQRHILLTEGVRELTDKKEYDLSDSELLSLLRTGKTGSIDRKTGRVSGVFAEATFFMDLDFEKLISWGLTTPDLLASVILHELGHLLTWILYCTHTASLNRLLGEAMERYQDPSKFRKALIVSLMEFDKQGGDLDKTALDALRRSKSSIVFSWQLSKILFDQQAAHSVHSLYDNSSSEQLADSFAARCGYGASLALSLSRFLESSEGGVFDQGAINATQTQIGMVSQQSLFITSVIKRALPDIVVMLGGMFVVALVVKLLASLIDALAKLIRGSQVPSEPVPNTMYTLQYDVLEDRIKRVRLTMILQLREQPNLPKVVRLALLSDIDRVAALLPPRPTTSGMFMLLNAVSEMVGRNTAQQIKTEQLLEEILANPLLVAASRHR